MTDEKTQYMSQDKLDELEKEYRDLKSEKIPTIAKRIDEARQLGDLSENAEYHSARDEMAWAQSRVKELQRLIDDAEVITNTGSKTVQIGSTIRVKSNKIEKEYTIVGAQEADPLSGKISNESPLGSAFIGKNKGDKIQITLPAGVQDYKILEVK
ncbi:transcription elongation factor GreA [Candidatus Parcubacteria bacterium]|nr:MAG: transcription elongation factor GreA [Candidatus Parcubacteria bacterium]